MFLPHVGLFSFPFFVAEPKWLKCTGVFFPYCFVAPKMGQWKNAFQRFLCLCNFTFSCLAALRLPSALVQSEMRFFSFPLLFLIHHSLLGSFPILFSLQVTFFGFAAFVSLSFGLLSFYPYMAVSSRSCNCPTSGRFPGFEAMLQSEQLLWLGFLCVSFIVIASCYITRHQGGGGVHTSVVVLDIGLGLKNGLETTF